MRTFFLLPVIAILFLSCGGGQSQAIEDQKAVYNALDDMKKKGGIPTTDGGWTMTAKIDGKSWKADWFMPLDAAGRIIGNYKKGNISLPYWRQGMVEGQKTAFKDGNAVDFFSSDDSELYGGYSGEMEITKVNGSWVEGKFNFTGTQHSSAKRVEVTDGFFRIEVK